MIICITNKKYGVALNPASPMGVYDAPLLGQRVPPPGMRSGTVEKSGQPSRLGALVTGMPPRDQGIFIAIDATTVDATASITHRAADHRAFESSRRFQARSKRRCADFPVWVDRRIRPNDAVVALK